MTKKITGTDSTQVSAELSAELAAVKTAEEFAEKTSEKIAELSAKASAKVDTDLFPDTYLALRTAMNFLLQIIPENLVPAMRRRLQGAGVRRYGLIDKTLDYAEKNIHYVPVTFDLVALKEAKRKIEELRDLQVVNEQIGRLIADGLLVYGNEAWNQTLLFYTSVREQARRNVFGAKELYDQLSPLFRKHSRKGEPTDMEVERDLKALLHNRKDGEIIVKNEIPHLEGGKHVVIDETHKASERWKATEEGEVND